MNRISGPDGLPHSCAEMVRPSGVFTLIGLCFSCCPRPGCAIATRNTAATVNLARRLPRRDIVIAILPVFYVVIGETDSRARAAWIRNSNSLLSDRNDITGPVVSGHPRCISVDREKSPPKGKRSYASHVTT